MNFSGSRPIARSPKRSEDALTNSTRNKLVHDLDHCGPGGTEQMTLPTTQSKTSRLEMSPYRLQYDTSGGPPYTDIAYVS